MNPSHPVTEERGIWLHRNDFIAPREEVLKFLDKLKEAHFTSVYIQTYFRGSVVYPDSRILPQFQEMAGSDILSWLMPEIKNRGMRSEAWMEYGFYAFHVPDAAKTTEWGVFLSLHPELKAIDADGIPYIHNSKWGDFFSLCPANPKSHELLADVCLETLSRYPFDGLNLDRIRFPGDHFCFCDFCKINFKKDTGLDLKPFPKGSLEYKMLVKWRNDRISRFLEVYSQQFRKVRPGVTVSLAALPPDLMESHSQPWDIWMKKGYLDAAMPMLYGNKDFEARVKTVLTFPCRNRIFCALDADGLKPGQIMRQIDFLKQNGASGFALWYSSAIRDDLPGLKSGPFAAPAVSPLAKSTLDF
jgi:uncharacterized lipoprotein YddW (UPF0748 family)